jgi:hypothetical protein
LRNWEKRRIKCIKLYDCGFTLDFQTIASSVVADCFCEESLLLLFIEVVTLLGLHQDKQIKELGIHADFHCFVGNVLLNLLPMKHSPPQTVHAWIYL